MCIKPINLWRYESMCIKLAFLSDIAFTNITVFPFRSIYKKGLKLNISFLWKDLIKLQSV